MEPGYLTAHTVPAEPTLFSVSEAERRADRARDQHEHESLGHESLGQESLDALRTPGQTEPSGVVIQGRFRAAARSRQGGPRPIADIIPMVLAMYEATQLTEE